MPPLKRVRHHKLPFRSLAHYVGDVAPILLLEVHPRGRQVDAGLSNRFRRLFWIAVGLEGRLANHGVAFLAENLTGNYDGDEFLGMPNLALETCPDLRLGENRGGSGRVYRGRVGQIECYHLEVFPILDCYVTGVQQPGGNQA